VRAGKIHEQELSTGGGKINLKNRSLERKSPDDNQRAPDPKRTTKPTTRKKNPCGRKICRRRGVLHSRANRAGNRLSGRANRAGAVWITARVLLARIDERSARFTGRTVWAQNEISGGIRIEHEANESRPGRDRFAAAEKSPGCRDLAAEKIQTGGSRQHTKAKVQILDGNQSREGAEIEKSPRSTDNANAKARQTRKI
jgi:hypothetical protein